MKCLENYIGLKYCNTEEPESGFYINDLQGITTRQLDSISSSEQTTFIETWGQITKRAVERFETAIIAELSKRHTIKSVFDSYKFGRNVNTSENKTSALEEYRGFLLSLGNYASDLQVIEVQSLSLYLKTDTSVTVKIFDLLNDVDSIELFTKTIDGKAGFNSIQVNKLFPETHRIFVCYDASEIESVETEIKTDFGCNVFFNSCESRLQGAKSSIDLLNIETVNNTFGLGGSVNVKCSYSGFVCNNKSLFKMAFAYLLGEEFMNERIYSDRLNRYTTIDVQKAKDLRAEFEASFKDELSTAISGISLDKHDCCLECNGLVTQTFMHP